LSADFLSSLRAELATASTTTPLQTFLTEKTYLNGKPFSFLHHEYQQFITNLIEQNPGSTFVVKKPSQIGLSELFNRLILARMALRSGEGVLVSFPSKIFAQEVIKTRITNIITASPHLRDLSDPHVDSASVKQFTNESILYGLSGSSSSNSSLLNRPISLIFVDELDRQDPNVYTGFHSRMTHTPEEDRLTFLLSTPTAPGMGIDAEYSSCYHQHQTLIKHSCGHIFDPDFFADIVIPGYDEAMALLTVAKASKLNLDGAYLKCPHCGQPVEYHRPGQALANEWEVVYDYTINPEGARDKIGIALTPFCAPDFIKPRNLVRAFLTYTSHVEFLNQGLGKTASLSDSSILPQHIHFINPYAETRHDYTFGARIFGLDLGKQCHFLSGLLRSDTTIFVDTIEVINLMDLEDFVSNFFLTKSTIAGVADSQPYTDLIYRMVAKHPRLYSAIYIDQVPAMLELFKLNITDKYGQTVRQMNINKNRMMDILASSLDDFVTFSALANPQQQDVLVTHLTDMRRTRDYRFREANMKRWVKSVKGVDHFFHACTYLIAASKLALANASLGNSMSANIPTSVHKFKHRLPLPGVHQR
jgi:hypothetical protein